MEELDLRAFVESLNQRELFWDYMDEIQYNLSRISIQRIELLIRVLVNQCGRMEAKELHFFGFNAQDTCVYIISDLLFRIDDVNKRYSIISNLFSNSDFESFQLLLHLLHIIELNYGRIVENSNVKNENLITLEQLFELEDIFLKRTKCFISRTNLLDWKDCRVASFLWEFIEKETYIGYMKEKLLDDMSVPKYISTKANGWSNSDGLRGYAFEDNTHSDFIDDETIIKIINRVRLIDSFWALNRKVIETTAAFVLKSANTTINHGVSYILINELIDKWEKEYKEQAIQ